MLISLGVAFSITPWLALRLAPKHAACGPRAREARPGARLGLQPPARAVRRSGARRRVAAYCWAPGSSRRSCCRCRSRPCSGSCSRCCRSTTRASSRSSSTCRRVRRSRPPPPRSPTWRRTSRRSTRSPTPGLCRHRVADQLQRARAPVRPAQPAASRATCRSTSSIAGTARARATRSRSRCVRRSRRSAARHGAKVKVVEVPPGPPVMSPIVAEIYGPDEAGRHAFAKLGARGVRPHAARRRRRRLDRGRRAARCTCASTSARPRSPGIAPADAVATLRAALAGENVTALRDGQAKYEVPVRLTLAARAAGPARNAARADGARRQRRGGAARPRSCTVEPAMRETTRLPQGPAAGDVRRRRRGGRRRQPALRHVRRCAARSPGSPRPHGGRCDERLHHAAVRPVPRVVDQVGRRVADHLRDVPRHGPRLRGRAWC